jgi:hypothetical protein
MSLENMMQARGYTGGGTIQVVFAGGMGRQMPAQALLGVQRVQILVLDSKECKA